MAASEVRTFGISSWAFPWAVGVAGSTPPAPLTAWDLLDRAVELSVDRVQIADNVPLHVLTHAELRDIGARARDLGIALEVGTVGLDPSLLRTYVGIAKMLGSAFVRFVIDTATHAPGEDEIVATLRGLIGSFEQTGVALLIENHDRLSAASLRRVLEAVGSPALGICLDTVNSLGGLQPVDIVLAELRPWIRNVHLKDFTIARVPNRMGFVVEGAPAGQGALDIPWLLSEVARLPHAASVVLEQWPPWQGGLEQTIAVEREWAATSIAYLSSLVSGDMSVRVDVPAPSTS